MVLNFRKIMDFLEDDMQKEKKIVEIEEMEVGYIFGGCIGCDYTPPPPLPDVVF